MTNSLFVRIVLQADVAGERSLLVVSPGVHELAVEAERVVRADAGQFITVPFAPRLDRHFHRDRKSTRLNSSHGYISYAVFCLKKKKKNKKYIKAANEKKTTKRYTLHIHPHVKTL